ncbi:hypothetical protein K402DRAFT_404261 [Aulographum hederae CBS 113979]|uniref:F-box domain-containing protein n=1 Tax=Aulographum hederae CBS 113979 TaxID=1176131 RepID=A0A6G1H0E8_9PEZI|nr:hypothetical protein K402DRAFT_404261 [Aulographum hederae CBS 113979]
MASLICTTTAPTALPTAEISLNITTHDVEPFPVSAFMSLPPEIHLLIIPHLPYKAQWALKRSCHYFHSFRELLAPRTFFQLRQRGADFQKDLYQRLIDAQMIRWGYEPCYACCRFRPKEWFEVGQWERSMWWAKEEVAQCESNDNEWDAEEGDEETRKGKYCVECGAKRGRYKRGDMIEILQPWAEYVQKKDRSEARLVRVNIDGRSGRVTFSDCSWARRNGHF